MSLIDPTDSLERQNAKLLKIADALMRRVEHGSAQSGAAYAQFERAALLEQRVRERTAELERTLGLLHDSNAKLAQANAATEAARRDLADAIETVSEGFALFDPQDRMVLCNARFCRDFRDMTDALRPGLSFADYVARISLSRDLALPDTLSSGDWAARRIHRHQDAAVMFNVELTQDRWLQVSEQRTGNGGTVILQTDVTDLVRMERQERTRLRDRQTQLIRATLDHLDQGVAIFDGDAQLVGWNDKLGALLGVPARRLQLGASFFRLIDGLAPDVAFASDGDRKGFVDWARSRAARGPIAFEISRAGRITLQIFGQGMLERGFVLSVTDVTAERAAARDLARMNEDLEQRVMARTLELEDALSAAERANSSKSRFVAAASHDLMQPLSAAKLYLGSLADRLTDPQDRTVLHKAEAALSGAEHLIGALLDISKLDAEGIRFDIRPVALRDILRPLVDGMEVLAARKGLRLACVDSSLIVKTDPAYLRRILQNLLSNAIRYTDTGRVLLGVRRQGAQARIEVHDSGPGIAEGDQTSIFEEFRRLAPQTGPEDGLGLGLAIVERACARLGHPLGLRSLPGRGSCFMVSLPISGETAETGQPVAAAVMPQGLAQAGLMVLLVENDPQMRRALSVLMESWGVHVIEAAEGAEALALLEDLQIRPDALVLDQQLGGGQTGSALYERLTERLGPLPCAIVSADRGTALEQVCATLKLSLLMKPVDRRALSRFLTQAASAMARGL